MNIRKLNEELKNILQENIGDKMYSHKTLSGNPYDVIDEGKVTFEFMGVPIEYQLTRREEFDKETGELIETDYRIECGSDINTELINQKISDEFKKQIKDNYGIEVTYIGGSTMVGIPNAGNFTK